MKRWYQVSVYRPDDLTDILEHERVSIEFLEKDGPTFMAQLAPYLKPCTERWHFLYEPHLLLRFEAYDGRVKDVEDIIKWVIENAWESKLVWKKGDITKSSPSGCAGYWFSGEHSYYLGTDNWETNADFLYAISRFNSVYTKDSKEKKKLLAKYIHLLLNQAGYDLDQEKDFLWERSQELLKQKEEKVSNE